MTSTYEQRRNGTPSSTHNTQRLSEALGAFRDEVLRRLAEGSFDGTVGVKISVKKNRVEGLDIFTTARQ